MTSVGVAKGKYQPVAFDVTDRGYKWRCRAICNPARCCLEVGRWYDAEMNLMELDVDMWRATPHADVGFFEDEPESMTIVAYVEAVEPDGMLFLRLSPACTIVGEMDPSIAPIGQVITMKVPWDLIMLTLNAG